MGATALGTGALAGLPSAAASPSRTQPAPATKVARFKPGPARYDAPVHGVTRAEALRAGAASSSFTQFHATVKVGTKSYTYSMAGKNPAIKVTNPSSTIQTKLVPLIIKFSDGATWNSTSGDSCDPGNRSALYRTRNSPLVVARSWTWGGTAIGNAQVTDAYQRADFWRYAKPGAINPTYGVKLAWTMLSPVTINVPNADAAEASIGCGNRLLGAINVNWLDPYLQSKVIPSLAGKGVNTTTLPIFLLHNVVEYEGNTANCCVLGYHNAFNTTKGFVQTYGLSIYDNSKAFAGSSDISALSHEVAEWQNDPYTDNPTPAWGNIGQVSGCQNNLEVGDPLSGTTFTAKTGTFTYHPQELAFFSWFYHQKTSLAVHRWYSDQGTFKSYAAPCS